MPGRGGIFDDQLLGYGVGLIFALALFVLDDAPLEIEHFLINGVVEVAHAIALEEEGLIEGGDRDVFEVVSTIFAGGAVEIGGADLLHGIDVAAFEIFAASEHEVFEEVGEAGLPGLLVFRPDVIPGVDGHDGGFVVLVHEDGEAVGEGELLVRDVDVGGEQAAGEDEQRKWREAG